MTKSCDDTHHPHDHTHHPCNPAVHVHIIEPNTQAIKRALQWSLLINALMAFVTLYAGFAIASTAVLMDSSDFLGDALMYAVSLWALHQSVRVQQRTAHMKIALMAGISGIAIYHMVINRQAGTIPLGEWMLVISSLSMIANSIVLWLLRPFKTQNANIYSAWICSQNDLLVGFTIAVCGVITWYTQSNIPDLITASVLVAISLWSVARYLKFQLDNRDQEHYH
jgi:Co/Zn/Cd efflux system component